MHVTQCLIWQFSCSLTGDYWTEVESWAVPQTLKMSALRSLLGIYFFVVSFLYIYIFQFSILPLLHSSH